MAYGLSKMEIELAGLNPDEYENVDFQGKFYAELIFKWYDKDNQSLWCFFDTHAGIKLKFSIKGKTKKVKRKTNGLIFPTFDKKIDFGQVDFNTFWVVVSEKNNAKIIIKSARQYNNIVT